MKTISNSKTVSPKLSVITVVYNGINYIERTINSIIDQDYKDFEFIIIDGGSTDGTLDIIKSYEKHITLWVSETDNGIYDAMNKAISLSKGEWVNFMNCSDVYANKHILSSIFSQPLNENVKAIYSDWYICDALNSPQNTILKKASWKKGNILHQSLIYKKDIHKEYNLYLITDGKFISDYLFFINILEKHVLKVNTPISINDINGVSYGSWSMKQKFIIDYLFGRSSFLSMFIELFFIKIKKITKSIIRLK